MAGTPHSRCVAGWADACLARLAGAHGPGSGKTARAREKNAAQSVPVRFLHRPSLDTKQMAGAFQLLRSNDLIWSRMVHDYLLGQREPMTDLMARNADTTRMPYRMHSEYLRSLFLNDDFAEGRFKVAGRPVTMEDVSVPIFAVATDRDHVAPWRSVFKFHLLTETELTFVLTNGGHNAGILSEPGHAGRHFRIARHQPGDSHLDPDTWLATNPPHEGSWWAAWTQWLAERSGEPVPPPPLGQADSAFAERGR